MPQAALWREGMTLGEQLGVQAAPIPKKYLISDACAYIMAHPTGFEPVASALEGSARSFVPAKFR